MFCFFCVLLPLPIRGAVTLCVLAMTSSTVVLVVEELQQLLCRCVFTVVLCCCLRSPWMPHVCVSSLFPLYPLASLPAWLGLTLLRGSGGGFWGRAPGGHLHRAGGLPETQWSASGRLVQASMLCGSNRTLLNPHLPVKPIRHAGHTSGHLPSSHSDSSLHLTHHETP